MDNFKVLFKKNNNFGKFFFFFFFFFEKYAKRKPIFLKYIRFPSK